MLTKHVSQRVANGLILMILFSPTIVALPVSSWVFYAKLAQRKPAAASSISAKRSLTWRFIGASLMQSFISFMWHLFLVLVFYMPYLSSSSQKITGNTIMYGCVLVFLHFLIMHISLNFVIYLFGMLLLLVSAFYPGPASLGGATLRALGAGGGLPASILLKTMIADKGESVAKQKSGCIVISIGSQFMFFPASDVGDCRKVMALLTNPFSNNNLLPKTYQFVEVYQRSDVLAITEFKPN